MPGTNGELKASELDLLRQIKERFKSLISDRF